MSLNYYTNKISGYVLVLVFTFAFISCGKDDKTESTGKKTESEEKSSGSDSKKDIPIGNDFFISYDLSGKVNGTMNMNKDGDKIKQVMNMEVMGMKTMNTTYIMKDYVYSITDVGGNKFGVKTALDEYNKTKKASGETITDFNDFGKFLGDKKVLGNETILGHDCETYETAKGIKISVFNKRYVLKIESPEFTAVATKIDTNPSFSSNEFEVPKDVDFKTTKGLGYDKGALDSLAKKYIK